MRRGIVLTGLGIAMWAISTLFFLLFGDWVVLEVSDAYFGSSLFLLEMLSFLLLIGIALVVRLKLFREKGSATLFGYIATAVGLVLSTLTILYRDSIFTGFTEGQHHGFTVWMTLTGALTLLVPAIVDRFVRGPAPVADAAVIGGSVAEESITGASAVNGGLKEEDSSIVELEPSTNSSVTKLD